MIFLVIIRTSVAVLLSSVWFGPLQKFIGHAQHEVKGWTFDVTKYILTILEHKVDFKVKGAWKYPFQLRIYSCRINCPK